MPRLFVVRSVPEAPALPVAEPWRPDQIGSVVWRLAVAAAGIFAGWYGVATTPDFNDQAPWLAVGVGGAVVGGLAVAAWLLAGFRSVRARQRLLLDRLAPDAPPAAGEPVVEDDRLVTAPGMTRYHRAGCLLVHGKATRPYGATRGRGRRLDPCGVCRP